MRNMTKLRDKIYWFFYAVNMAAVFIAVASTDDTVMQLFAEWYVTFVSVLIVLFSILVLLDKKSHDNIAIHVERRRVPNIIEWAALLVLALVGWTLGNWLIGIAAILQLILKPKLDRLQERLRLQSLPQRAIRDGSIHADELKR